jgi:hypothetical protein
MEVGMPFWNRKQAQRGPSKEKSARQLIEETFTVLDGLQRRLRNAQYVQLSRAQRGQILSLMRQGISAKQMDVAFKADLNLIDNSRDQCSTNLRHDKERLLATFDALSQEHQNEYAGNFLAVSSQLYEVATNDPDTAGIDGAKARLIFYNCLFGMDEMREQQQIDHAAYELAKAGLYDAMRAHFLAYEGVPDAIEKWLRDRSDEEAARSAIQELRGGGTDSS